MAGVESKERMPRNTKLTPELQTAICQYVAAGAPLPLACEAAGVSWNTAKDWKSKPGEPYESFTQAVKQAKARWAVAAAMRLTKASEKHYQAAQWLLERRLPQYYRPPRQRVEQTGADGGPIRIDGRDTSQLSLAEIEAEIRKRNGGER